MNVEMSGGSSAIPLDYRALVQQSPWAFFHIPKDSWSRELALIAWRQVGFVLAEQSVDFLPDDYFANNEWEQFVELLCDGDSIHYQLVSENRKSWQEVVSAINSYMAASCVCLTAEPLPELD